MRHVVSFTTASGRSYDLSSLDSSGVLWDNALMSWEMDYEDDGTPVRQAASFDATALFPSVAAANDFMADSYADTEAGDEGSLNVDGWTLTCSLGAGAPQVEPGGRCRCAVTFHARTPLWRRTTSHELIPGDSAATTGLDLPTDLPYDLAGTGLASGTVRFRSASRFLVRCVFWGPCSNPRVDVASTTRDGRVTRNRYGVTASAERGQRLVIDPQGRYTIGGSVYLVDSHGTRTNMFDRRLRGVEGSGSYVFQALPAGSVSASWPQGYGVTLELVEERGSLPWI